MLNLMKIEGSYGHFKIVVQSPNISSKVQEGLLDGTTRSEADLVQKLVDPSSGDIRQSRNLLPQLVGSQEAVVVHPPGHGTDHHRRDLGSDSLVSTNLPGNRLRGSSQDTSTSIAGIFHPDFDGPNTVVQLISNILVS